MRSSTINGPTLMNSLVEPLASRRRTMGSAGDGSGSMPPASPIPTASRKTSRGRCGPTAIGSSMPSTATCPTTSFIIEQLAGDQLPHATQDQIVATGFLRNSMINEEGGVDPEQFRMEAMFDRMDAIGKGVLGLTIQCAQCHSHKFDPISQGADYYRMFAFLNNDYEANVAVYTPDEQNEAGRPVSVRSKTIEDGLRAPHARLGAKRDRTRGRTRSAAISRNGRCSARLLMKSRPAAKNFFLSPMGRC